MAMIVRKPSSFAGFLYEKIFYVKDIDIIGTICYYAIEVIDMEPKDIRIARFQSCLPTLRKVAGWTAEDLGNKLDVSRQTIINLESKKIEMTKIQYIAFRTVFEAEATTSNNDTLGNLIKILVDSDSVPDEKKDELKQTVSAAVSSVGPRAGSEAASKKAIKALELPLSLLGVLAGGLLVSKSTANWLFDVLTDKK